MDKRSIKSSLLEMRKALTDTESHSSGVSVLRYQNLVRVLSDGREIWTDALQAAVRKNTVVRIPSKNTPYYIDKTLILPSHRHIEAEENAVVTLLESSTVLLLRNERTKDGTRYPIGDDDRDTDISINGGRWEESRTERAGCGKSGMYDENRSFYGVSACMFFNNIRNLVLTNMTFAHTAGFAVQTGDLENGVFENIQFDSCYADGLHINGNAKCLFIRNISGQVGDDLVALNMYDWQNSSVDFGPAAMIYCENLLLSDDSRYKALRIEPGRYRYADGTEVDCSVTDLYICRVRGIRTFKLYFQTPRYKIGTPPETGDVGSADNLYFEDIEADLSSPIDPFPEYTLSDPIRGSSAVFEIGADIGTISFENINVRLHKDILPMSFLLCVGPKSVVKEDTEIFDPYLSCTVHEIILKNVCINGSCDWDIADGIREIAFDDINADGHSTASGKIVKVTKE